MLNHYESLIGRKVKCAYWSGGFCSICILKQEKSNLKLPHKNVKVCLFHEEGISNIKSTGTTFIFDEKSPVWVSVSVSTSREAGEGALLTDSSYVSIEFLGVYKHGSE